MGVKVQKLEDIGMSGALADRYKCFDHLVRPLLYEMMRLGDYFTIGIGQLSRNEIVF